MREKGEIKKEREKGEREGEREKERQRHSGDVPSGKI